MLITDLSGGQLILMALPILPNLLSLHHAFTHDFADPREKSRWVLACIFLPCIAGIAYLAVGRRHARRAEGPRTVAAADFLEGRGAHRSLADEAQERNAEAKEARQRLEGWSFGCPDEKNG